MLDQLPKQAGSSQGLHLHKSKPVWPTSGLNPWRGGGCLGTVPVPSVNACLVSYSPSDSARNNSSSTNFTAWQCSFNSHLPQQDTTHGVHHFGISCLPNRSQPTGAYLNPPTINGSESQPTRVPVAGGASVIGIDARCWNSYGQQGVVRLQDPDSHPETLRKTCMLQKKSSFTVQNHQAGSPVHPLGIYTATPMFNSCSSGFLLQQRSKTSWGRTSELLEWGSLIILEVRGFSQIPQWEGGDLVGCLGLRRLVDLLPLVCERCFG